MGQGWTGWASAAWWFLVAVGAFLAFRAGSTLATGASWEMPGDGWRSVWQLLVVAIAVVGVLRPSATRTAVVIIAVMYAGSSVLELFNGAELLGWIPVDIRDRVVHPLVAVLAVACLLVQGVAPRGPRTA